MTSSSSSSSRARLAVLLAATLLGACAGQPRARAPGEVVRVAILPVDNMSGATLQTRALLPHLEQALARRGFEVVTGDAVDGFLARHRMRYTGAVEPPAARAAREELAADALLVTTIEEWAEGPPPRVVITQRLVSTTDEPRIVWIDGVARTGDEAPGLLGLGVVSSIKVLQERALAQLARSAAAGVRGSGPAAPRCPDDGTFDPKIPYRARRLSSAEHPRVAVLPFMNGSRTRAAGDLLALAFVRALSAQERFHVLEPGVVRDLLLRFRIILEGGVNLEQARSMLGALEVDLVVTGDVFEYTGSGSAGATRVDFVSTVLDGRSGKVVWQSSSHNRGDDGRLLFEAGLVSTTHGVACRMVRNVVDGLVARRPPHG